MLGGGKRLICRASRPVTRPLDDGRMTAKALQATRNVLRPVSWAMPEEVLLIQVGVGLSRSRIPVHCAVG